MDGNNILLYLIYIHIPYTAIIYIYSILLYLIYPILLYLIYILIPYTAIIYVYRDMNARVKDCELQV